MSEQQKQSADSKRHKSHHRGGGGGRGGARGGGGGSRGGAPPIPLLSDLPLPEGGLDIDGSQLEGGGQILRNAAALAAILHRPIKVHAIRAGRANPGLRPQHLTGLQLIADLSGGELQGGVVGSSVITLAPGPLRCGRHVGDTRTAGSCMLLAQSALPCLLYAAPGGGGGGDGGAHAAATATPATTCSQLELRGGTNAAMAPPLDYFEHVLLPSLRSRLGIAAQMRLERRGFFPRGGGVVHLTVEPLGPGACLPPVALTERGQVVRLATYAFTAGKVPQSVAQRMAAAADKELKRRLPECGMAPDATLPVELTHEPAERAAGDGCAILLVAETSTGCLLGASALGERGVPAEALGQQAATELADMLASGTCVDEHLQDQLIIFMALAKGESRVLAGEPSLHTRTAIEVAQELLPAAKFSITPQAGGCTWLITCQGAGVRGASGYDESVE